MEKIIHTTIGGVSFQFEENANRNLGAYLAEIRKHLSSRPDASEIAEDIEARVADVLLEINGDATKVITEEIVSKVIERIGQPTEIDFGEEPKAAKITKPQDRYAKRLYRDTSNSVFAGVCSGLGAYFNSDPILFRVAFLVLFFLPIFSHHWINGFAIILYAVLWIIVPKAKSHRQQLEMHGKPFNINTVKDNVAQEFKEASNSLKARTGHGGFMERLGMFLGELLLIVGKIFVVFFKVIFGLISVIFITIGISLVILLFAIMFFDAGNLVTDTTTHCSIYIQELASIFVGTEGFWGVSIAALVLILIPTLGLIYLGLRLAFRFKSNDRLIGSTALLIFIMALVVGAVFSFSEIREFRKSSWEKTVQQVSNQKSDTLTLTAGELIKTDSCCDLNINDDNDRDFYLYTDGKSILRLATLNIENGKSQPLSAWVDQFSLGADRTEASSNAKRVDISVEQNSDTLNIDPVITFSKSNKWRFQKGCVNISIPEGTVVHFDSNMRKLLENSSDSHTYVAGYMSGKYYTMTENGLKEVEKK